MTLAELKISAITRVRRRSPDDENRSEPGRGSEGQKGHHKKTRHSLEISLTITNEIQQAVYDTTLAVLANDERALKEISETQAEAMQIAVTFLLDALLYATEEENLTPRELGRLSGLIHLEALGVVAGGAGVAAKASKVPKITRFLDRMSDLAKNTKMPAGMRRSLQKAIDAPKNAIAVTTELAGSDNRLAEAISWIKPRKVMYDVVVHGTPDAFKVLHGYHKRDTHILQLTGGFARILCCEMA